ncbi:MAG: hypothetical protein A3E87_05605 [Gammaproteobacteria bacterium RIFCSPHIGHO2_12_FULL_35_23]|nr:MAG: hypothetical protein A3E87_05605 [Gammaproteobacteria bacterium RIFCSPHIGHO2_12_FULL_35_23]
MGRRSPSSPFIHFILISSLKFKELLIYCLSQSLITKILFKLTPEELHNIDNFINSKFMKPYAEITYAQIEEIILAIKNIRTHPAFTIVKHTLQMPIIGRMIILSGALICDQLEIPKDLFKLLTDIITKWEIENILAKLEHFIATHEITHTVIIFDNLIDTQRGTGQSSAASISLTPLIVEEYPPPGSLPVTSLPTRPFISRQASERANRFGRHPIFSSLTSSASAIDTTSLNAIRARSAIRQSERLTLLARREEERDTEDTIDDWSKINEHEKAAALLATEGAQTRAESPFLFS